MIYIKLIVVYLILVTSTGCIKTSWPNRPPTEHEKETVDMYRANGGETAALRYYFELKKRDKNKGE